MKVYTRAVTFVCAREFSIYITRDHIVCILMLPFPPKSSIASTQFNLQYIFQRIQRGNFFTRAYSLIVRY